VDADIASALLLEIPNGFDQSAVEHRRIGPISVKGRRCRDILRDLVDECREWLDLATRPELRPLAVATAAEDDRVLCSCLIKPPKLIAATCRTSGTRSVLRDAGRAALRRAVTP
jgi:hypothetical protein